MAIRVSIFFLFLFSSISTIHSIFEDQVGLTDWHQQYIGKVKHAVFHTQKAARKRVIVSTEENVVASLDLRHGQIFWRHVLAADDVIDGIDIALGKYVITLSSGGSILRAWNLPDGQMVWESILAGSAPSKSLLLVPMKLKTDKDNLILVYGRGYIHAISGIDGEVIWEKDLAHEGFDIQHLVNLQGSDAIHAVGSAGSSQFVVYEIHTKSGEILKHQSVELPGLFSGDISMISADTALALDSSRSNLLLVCFGNGQISVQKTPITDLVPYSSVEALIVPTEITRIAALRFGNSIALIRVTDDGKLEALNTINDVAAISDSLLVTEGQEAFALAQHGDNKIELTVKLVNDMPNNLLEESVRMDHQRGPVQKVFINHYIRTDRSYGFRALIVMEDHSLLLIQQGEIVWSREDGLASVIDVTTSELPLEKNGVSVAKVEHSLFEWLQGHLLKLKGTLMLATPVDIAAIQRMRLQSSGKSKMTRDHNGFRKLIIVLTKAGKIFALHSGDGRIVWSHLLSGLRKSETCATLTGLSLYQWQVPHHHAMDENPSVLVIGRCGGSLDAPGVISIVDAYTGSELTLSGPSHSIVEVIPLPYTDSTEQRLHVLIDAESHAYLYPRNPEALGIFQQELGNIYWYSVDAEDNTLRGYGLKNFAIEESDDYCYDIRILWSIVFPAESEKILATSRRKLNEVVHTQAKVMTDQEVMYKYISKNVLFVATVAPQAVGDIGSVTPDESLLVIYLIDTVTGRILYRMTHHGAQGPVRAVFSENWVVYHYFNLRAHRYEMSVIEIYDQSRADNKDMLKLVFGKHNLTSPMSSYSRPEVTTKSQSYFFTHSVKTMAVTLTAKGVTSKQILIGTIGDQVLALDKRFLDPRRTLNPTQAEKEEGIIPLTDSLPIIPQSYVTHSLKVEGLRGIVTIPAKLESTTLVFAYGIDLFYTRLAPSKTYDSLTEDFSYALLLITIAALVIAIFVTWVLSERKELQEKWR